MNKRIVYITTSPSQTKKLGGLLAKAILENRPGRRGRVLALAGDLGAGKTNFIQRFAKGLGLKGAINSPTFVILKKYPLERCGGFKTFYHIDCYRLASGTDLAQMGVAAILRDPADIVAVEWPEIVKDVLPEDILKINFKVAGANQRRIEFVS